MKKLLCLLMCGFICLSLAACGGNNETAKSAELKNQYSFYETSIKKIIDGTKVTAGQADEIFIILVSCGLDDEITSVYKNNLTKDEDMYSYYWSGNVATYNFVLSGGVVQKVLNGESVLYPESEVKKQKEEEAAKAESDKEAAKSVAIILDDKAYQAVLNSEKTFALLQEGIDLISNGTGNELDLYNLAKEAKKTQFTLYSSLTGLRDKNSEKYIDACQLYITNGQMFAEKLLKYLDKDELKYLSEAKECITSSTTYVSNVAKERMSYLSSQGLSDEEVTEILTKDKSE